VGVGEWIVTNASYANTLTSDYGDTKSGNFVIVDFTFTNIGDEAVTLTTSYVVLLDSQGREFEPDTDTSATSTRTRTSSSTRSTPASPSKAK
jgi:hypothetical protein